jgi:hypothetical protein
VSTRRTYLIKTRARAEARRGEKGEVGRREREREREEVAAEGGGEVGNGDRTLEKRRRSGWVRWRWPKYPGRSSAANRDEEESGPWAHTCPWTRRFCC